MKNKVALLSLLAPFAETQVFFGKKSNEKLLLDRLLCSLFRLGSQFIHEVKTATMEGLFELVVVLEKECLDVHFWQFKHIKLIFIYVGMKKGQSQDTLFT